MVSCQNEMGQQACHGDAMEWWLAEWHTKYRKSTIPWEANMVRFAQ
jgi:hypothetical protein